MTEEEAGLVSINGEKSLPRKEHQIQLATEAAAVVWGCVWRGSNAHLAPCDPSVIRGLPCLTIPQLVLVHIAHADDIFLFDLFKRNPQHTPLCNGIQIGFSNIEQKCTSPPLQNSIQRYLNGLNTKVK